MDRDQEITSVDNKDLISQVVFLADEIWREHYTSIIGKPQVDYMLENFQSAEAIQAQIDEGASYYLINHKGQSAGYFSFYTNPDHLFLSKIYVKSSLRGKGLGRKAVEFIEKEAIRIGTPSILLTVNKNNQQTINTYKKIGFEITRPLIMDIGGGFVMDDFEMRKNIV